MPMEAVSRDMPICLSAYLHNPTLLVRQNSIPRIIWKSSIGMAINVAFPAPVPIRR